MATAGSNAGNEATSGGGGGSSNNVPQWKRDLIQRRRQQSKVLANNGASVKLCSAVIGTTLATSSSSSSDEPSVVPTSSVHEEHCPSVTGAVRAARFASEDTHASCCCGGGGGSGASISLSSSPSRRPPLGGATVVAAASGATAADFASSPVACNMRLEAELSLCSDAEDVVNSAPAKYPDTTAERKSLEYTGEESGEEAAPRTSESDSRPSTRARMSECSENEGRAVATGRGPRDAFAGMVRPATKERVAPPPSRASSGEDAESDSSEELQYGPGIVNKLKSKYLNLTLRETNKSRASVQRFRRAASLEDLLDRDDEEAPGHEKNVAGRKYAKRSGGGGGSGAVNAAKTDRYRNASRGNDSMKRARSVETLMRYNSVTADEAAARQVPAARPATTNGVRSEPVNDHIILIDRTSVKIESRLGELDRPKPINKPKRIKPVLAETERPPQDLVKTTMRIFEVSARRLKLKGEVAAKVATFKTINDTLKAQKKLVPKPPVQPKPFINGGARAVGVAASPKKIVLPQKPTAELIEDGKEEYHIDGVITEPIVQSVSSVVSRFQQIEKSHSTSPSPEPAAYKLKFSPANSPEPQSFKPRSAAALEISVKSPPVTPVLSPRLSSPRLQSPPSPVKDVRLGSQSPSSPVKDPIRIQIPNSLYKPPLPSPPVKESPKTLEPESTKARPPVEKEPPRTNVEQTRQPRLPESSGDEERKEDASRASNEEEDNAEEEVVDGAKTISKAALDNISRAGITMQFNFGDQPTSDKSYLPGAKQNGQSSIAEDDCCGKIESGDGALDVRATTATEATCRLQERLEPEKTEKPEAGKEDVERLVAPAETKPIGAICSLSLIKPAATTHPQSVNNETKTLRAQQRNEFSPPQKQIGIIRPLVTTKTQHPQQSLSNRELEKNLINRVKSIEQPTKVVVSLKSADEIQPARKASAGGGLWDTKPWNQQNNTMVFNFSNRKDVPDYIENDGLIIRRKREKPKVGDGIIVLDATLDASTTDDAEWEISGGPPSPCDVSFLNDNVLINGRSNLSRTPRNHKHRIQFDDTATRTFEYPSESSILEGETSSVDGETSTSVEQQSALNNKTSTIGSSVPSLLGGGGLASYTPSKVDLASEGFELGITRAVSATPPVAASSAQVENPSEVEYLRPAQDAGAWGSETTGDLLY